MSESDKKHPIYLVPAILTGSAALVAALTTSYVNLHDSASAGATAQTVPAQVASQPQTSPQTTAAAKPPEVAAPAVIPLRVQVDRIAVAHDGTMGTTDWRFSVEADAQPLFVFSQPGLDDEGGRNIAQVSDAAAVLRATEGKTVAVVVKGWRESRFHTASAEPEVQGQGEITANGEIAPIEVSAAKREDGAFTFYLSAEREHRE